jgi:hypothetical protein
MSKVCIISQFNFIGPTALSPAINPSFMDHAHARRYICNTLPEITYVRRFHRQGSALSLQEDIHIVIWDLIKIVFKLMYPYLRLLRLIQKRDQRRRAHLTLIPDKIFILYGALTHPHIQNPQTR